MQSYFDVDLKYLLQGPGVFRNQFQNSDLKEWNRLGLELWRRFKEDPNWESRIHFYYLPLIFWLKEMRHQFNQTVPPFVMGINGPQGCGKSTLTSVLVHLLSMIGFRSVSLSIDDFYLTRKEQIALAQKFPNNRFLQQRGYPGTHDIELGFSTLQALKTISEDQSVSLPRYDKSKYQGQGDRMPRSQWQQVFGPLDFIFFEGWMLGFTSAPAHHLPDSELGKINELLGEYKPWHDLLDGFLQLAPLDPNFVIQWRVEAEERARDQGKAGMSRTEIAAYIHKFMPAYKIYLPELLKSPPVRDCYLQLILLESRLLEKN